MRRIAAAGAVLGIAVAMIAVPAPAGATSTGNSSVVCESNLPAFPTSVPRTGTCNGTAVVELAGVLPDGHAYTLSGGALNNFTSTFTYADGCVSGQPPLTGGSQGTSKITNIPATHNGVVTTATITANFTSTRVGFSMITTTSGATVTFASGGPHGSGALLGGTGVAAFIPVPGGAAPTCPDGPPSKSIVIAPLTLSAA